MFYLLGTKIKHGLSSAKYIKKILPIAIGSISTVFNINFNRKQDLHPW